MIAWKESLSKATISIYAYDFGDTQRPIAAHSHVSVHYSSSREEISSKEVDRATFSRGFGTQSNTTGPSLCLAAAENITGDGKRRLSSSKASEYVHSTKVPEEGTSDKEIVVRTMDC